MSESTGSCINVATLKVGLIRFEHWENFPKVIGFPGLLSHHGTFDFWGIGLGCGFLFFLRFSERQRQEPGLGLLRRLRESAPAGQPWKIVEVHRKGRNRAG